MNNNIESAVFINDKFDGYCLPRRRTKLIRGAKRRVLHLILHWFRTGGAAGFERDADESTNTKARSGLSTQGTATKQGVL